MSGVTTVLIRYTAPLRRRQERPDPEIRKPCGTHSRALRGGKRH